MTCSKASTSSRSVARYRTVSSSSSRHASRHRPCGPHPHSSRNAHSSFDKPLRSSSYSQRHSCSSYALKSPSRSSSHSSSRSSSSSCSSRTRRCEDLPLEWWERGEDCKEAKTAHTERIDRMCGSREDLVLQTTLWRAHTVLEPNMFPYDTPYGVEHLTLWSLWDLQHHEIVSFVDDWLAQRMPWVRRWQYDDNLGDRSVLLFHVHVFVETRPYAFRARPGMEYVPPHCQQPQLEQQELQ